MLDYGDWPIGLIIMPSGDGWFGHGGSYYGTRTMALFHPEDDVGFLVFTNGEDDSVVGDGLFYQLLLSEANKYQ